MLKYKDILEEKETKEQKFNRIRLTVLSHYQLKWMHIPVNFFDFFLTKLLKKFLFDFMIIQYVRILIFCWIFIKGLINKANYFFVFLISNHRNLWLIKLIFKWIKEYVGCKEDYNALIQLMYSNMLFYPKFNNWLLDLKSMLIVKIDYTIYKLNEVDSMYLSELFYLQLKIFFEYLFKNFFKVNLKFWLQKLIFSYFMFGQNFCEFSKQINIYSLNSKINWNYIYLADNLNKLYYLKYWKKQNFFFSLLEELDDEIVLAYFSHIVPLNILSVIECK